MVALASTSAVNAAPWHNAVHDPMASAMPSSRSSTTFHGFLNEYVASRPSISADHRFGSHTTQKNAAQNHHILQASHEALSGTTDAPDSEDHDVEERSVIQPRKRPRLRETRMIYPRKRAVTACQLCRMKKTKCDNKRPSCTSCVQSKVDCVYLDQKNDMSTFDPASLQILDRLNYSIRLIEEQAQTLSQVQASTILQLQSHSSVASLENSTTGLSPTHNRTLSRPSVGESPLFDNVLENNAAALSEALEIGVNCSSARVLEWPIFDGCCDADAITAPFFEATITPQNASNRNTRMGRGIEQEDASALIRAFLCNVHIKNPILDPAKLRTMGREICEQGFGWDGPSCLVLIACGLANLSGSFTVEQPADGEISCLDAPNYFTAEAYYNAARKRIGLLGNSLLATQCYFLIGVYEMYSLRPLAAWLSFNHACTTFQTYLRTPSRHDDNGRSSKRLEQRLYWTCLKSECEMRDEVDLPPSGLAKVEYPDIFPSPPGGSPEPAQNNQAELLTADESLFQYSWYYYLSEIACRRIANRISHALHITGHSLWTTMPLRRMERIAVELEAQVIQWFGNIPQQVATESQDQSDELTYMLQGRFLDLNERIWRPFLYLAIHQTYVAEDEVKVSTYAQRSLDLIVKYIDHGAIKHRHHGSWYGCRQLFTMSLLLLAAVKSQKITLPPDWRSKIDLVLTCLRYWEGEAPDLQQARLSLENMVAVTST